MVDPKTASVRQHVPFALDRPGAAAVGEHGIWFADLKLSRDAYDADAGKVWRVDPRTGTPAGTIAVDGTPAAVAVGFGSVWVANSTSGTVSRIDPRTNTVTRTLRLGASPTGIATGAGLVWVSPS